MVQIKPVRHRFFDLTSAELSRLLWLETTSATKGMRPPSHQGSNKAVQDTSLAAKSTVYSESREDGKDVLSMAGHDYKWDEVKIWKRGEKMLRFMIERWALPHQEKESDFLLDFTD